MRETAIKKRLKASPFRPFRLHVSDGASYEIVDPDVMLVLTGQIIIGLEPDEGGIPQKAIYVDPIHVTRVTPINGE
jgi:hypothetical protein